MILAAGIAIFTFIALRRENWITIYPPPEHSRLTISPDRQRVALWRIGMADNGNTRFTNILWTTDSEYHDHFLDKDETEQMFAQLNQESHKALGPTELSPGTAKLFGLVSKPLNDRQAEMFILGLGLEYFFGKVSFNVGSIKRPAEFCFVVNAKILMPCLSHNDRLDKQ